MAGSIFTRFKSFPQVSRSHVGPPPAKERALDRLVPGDYPQTETDLAAFPTSTLDLLARCGVKVAILEPGQTLADSPGLPGPEPSQYQEQQSRANAIFLSYAQDHTAPVETMDDLHARGERLTRLLREDNLDFSVGLALNDFTASELAEQQQIPKQHREAWGEALLNLNFGLLQTQESGRLLAPTGLVVLPFTYHQGRPVAQARLRSAQQTDSEFVERSLGLHRAEDRLVLLHDRFLDIPAQEVGNYRLAIHEMGHALDHILDQLTGFPGFGSLHRQTVDALYQADLARAESQPVEEVFTSDRAAEDVREYFAEAVEAYLTQPSDDGGDIFRAENSNPGLLARNPALHTYMAEIFSTDFGTAPVPAPPVRSLLPEGYPDPELAVHRVA